MDYIELNCTITPKEPFSDLVIAELAEIGFDMFEEHESGIKAYKQSAVFKEIDLNSISWFQPNDSCVVTWSSQIIKHKNWNEEWEKNYNPVTIAGKIIVRATFHPARPEFDYEIVIQPKMSFGTGHHETTALVMAQMLLLNFKNKSVLDMGCGSGILAILAGMLGATTLWAVDYDTNATENAIENCNTNGFPNVVVKTGSVEVIKNQKFEIIIANINRNILLEQLTDYAQSLTLNGSIILSGFYEEDVRLLLKEAEKNGLKLAAETRNNKWCALFLKKPTE